MRAVDADYQAQAGEVVFEGYATAEQLAASFCGYVLAKKKEQYVAINNTYSAKLEGILTAISQQAAIGNSVTALQLRYVATQTEWKTAILSVK